MSYNDSKTDRIPTYEESIANTPRSAIAYEKSSQRLTLQQRIRQERLKRITNLVCEEIEPCINTALEDGLNHMSIVLLPSDTFSTTVSVTKDNIIAPTLQANTTLTRLFDDAYKSSFLQQHIVVQELSTAIQNAISDPNLSQPQAQAALSQALPVGDLPARPAPASWIRRTFGMPSEDHDPTGSTGSWNLGWKEQENLHTNHKTVTVDGMEITTRLQDVSFRTESELGLMESKTVKCPWIDIEISS